MITVSVFANAEPHKVNESTVVSWLYNEYIGGAEKKDGVWFIPDDAKKPYTKNRIRENSKRDAVIKSILTGLNNNYAVFPKLYSKKRQDSQFILDDLLAEGYITIIERSCKVRYYDITAKGIEYLSRNGSDKKQILKEALVTTGKIADAVKEVAATVGKLTSK